MSGPLLFQNTNLGMKSSKNVSFFVVFRYLKRHEYGTAVTSDLWIAISDAWNNKKYNFSVQELMDGWTMQMGYPLIVFEQQNDTNIYTIKQERYYQAISVSNIKTISAIL